MRNSYYPNRLSKIADATLEEGKGLVIEKLRTITLVEDNLQMLMRMYLNSLEEELIKEEKIFKGKLQIQKKLFIRKSCVRKTTHARS